MVDRVSGFNFVKPFQTSSDPIFSKDPITLKKPISVFKNTLKDTPPKSPTPPSFHKRLTTIVPLGPEFPVNTYITNNQENPVVAKLTNGNIAVIWAGEGIGDIDGIFGTVLNPDGTQNSTEFRANTDTSSYQVYPALTGLNNGNFGAAWHTPFKDGNGFGVFARLFYPNTTGIGTEFQVNSYTASDQKNAAIAASNDNSVLSWESPQDGSGIGIRGQLFYPNKTKIGGEFAVNTYTPGYQQNSAIASSKTSGDFLIVWESASQTKIRGQVYNPDKSRVGSEINMGTISYSEFFPATAGLDNGKYAVVWHSEDRDGDGYGIFGQIINANGSKSGGDFQINTNIVGHQMYPSSAGLRNGKFVVVWQSAGDIIVQILNPNGSKNGSEFIANSSPTGSQYDPSVADLGNDRFVVVWEDSAKDT
nr:hypothetical protein [Candidatus Anoxychlamydiales bacterium]